MRKVALVCCMLMVAGPAFAQSPPAEPQANGESSSLVRPLLIGVGVVAGALLTDAALGGNLAARLIGTAPAVAAQPVVSRAAFQEARANAAVVGDYILAATEARDVPARAGLLRATTIGLGAVAGWLGVSWLMRQ